MELINSIVNVTSYSFHRGRDGRQFKSFPKQIEFGNTQFTFRDGFQYCVRKAGKEIRLFDMSDGHLTYRLRHEDDQWMLVGTRPA
jgi:hypothetical protein